MKIFIGLSNILIRLNRLSAEHFSKIHKELLFLNHFQLATSFYESCEYDVCANQLNLTAAKESACGILATVATHCQSIQIPVVWRTVAKCRKSCTLND